MYVADYVLMEYGTGAIMAVPGHDERDYEFAKPFTCRSAAWSAAGTSCRSPVTARWSTRAEFDGLNKRRLEKIVDWLEREGKGHRSINYRLRDWLLSRQRYWGCPIPIIYCETRHGAGARGGSAGPAARCRGFTPQGSRRWRPPRAFSTRRARSAAAPARRETDTMDTFVDSSWYFLRYRTPTTTRRLGAKVLDTLDAGRPVRRRRRARDPAPDLRALLREGAGGPRADRGAGALQGPVHAGDDHPRRGEDVQVEGQHDQPGAVRRALRRGHGARLHPVHRPPDQDADWTDEGVEGVPASWPGCGAGVDIAAQSAAAAAGPAGAAGGRRPRADAQGALGDREGHLRHGRAIRVQHRDRRGHGAGQRGLPPARERGAGVVHFAARRPLR